MTEKRKPNDTVGGMMLREGVDALLEIKDKSGKTVATGSVSGFIGALRDRLGLHDVPFLVGWLGDFLEKFENPIFKNYVYVNDALRRVAEKRERVGFVSAEGLKGNPDNMHFSAKALREFGVRYYEEFLKHEDKNKVFEEKPSADLAIVNELETL